DPRRRHDFSLTELRHRHAGSAGLHLKAGDVRRLVGLHVGAQYDPVPPGEPGHFLKIRIEPLPVDQQRGGVELVDGTTQHIRAPGLVQAGHPLSFQPAAVPPPTAWWSRLMSTLAPLATTTMRSRPR